MLRGEATSVAPIEILSRPVDTPEPVGFRRPPPTPSLEHQKKQLADAVERLEQQLRDALFARSSHNLSEGRILELAFRKFDRDGSGHMDMDEFCMALEHLGLHVEGLGAPGLGGIPRKVVEVVFGRFDADGSGHIDYKEFMEQLLTNVTHRHF